MVEKKKSILVNSPWFNSWDIIHFLSSVALPSTVTQDAIIYPPLPILTFENYANALFRGSPEGYGAKVCDKDDDELCNHGNRNYSWKNNYFIFEDLYVWLIHASRRRIVPTYEVVANLNLIHRD